MTFAAFAKSCAPYIRALIRKGEDAANDDREPDEMTDDEYRAWYEKRNREGREDEMAERAFARERGY